MSALAAAQGAQPGPGRAAAAGWPEFKLIASLNLISATEREAL